MVEFNKDKAQAVVPVVKGIYETKTKEYFENNLNEWKLKTNSAYASAGAPSDWTIKHYIGVSKITDPAEITNYISGDKWANGYIEHIDKIFNELVVRKPLYEFTETYSQYITDKFRKPEFVAISLEYGKKLVMEYLKQKAGMASDPDSVIAQYETELKNRFGFVDDTGNLIEPGITIKNAFISAANTVASNIEVSTGFMS